MNFVCLAFRYAWFNCPSTIPPGNPLDRSIRSGPGLVEAVLSRG